MNTTKLDKDKGMIFIFPNEAPRTFWMKNTLISLDIIFLNSNFEVVKIHKNTLTNQTDIVYPSEESSKYVIELNAGSADKFGINQYEKLELTFSNI